MASRTIFFLFSILSSGIGHSFDMSSNPDSENIQWPSCGELRHLWLMLRRITYHGEITNEIPLIPSDLTANLLGYRRRNSDARVSPISEKHGFSTLFPNAWSKDKVHIRPTKMDVIGESFPQRPADVPQYSPRVPISPPKPLNNIDLGGGGFFGGFENGFRTPEQQLFPNEPMGKQIPVFPTIINAEEDEFEPKSLDVKEQIPNLDGIYGAEEDVGSFGNFHDQNEFQGQRKPDTRTVKLSNIKWHNQPASVESEPQAPKVLFLMDSCDAMEKSSCSTSGHCECVGWKTLRCINGECRAIQTASAERVEDMGIWHNGPLASFQLGKVNQKRRRAKRSKLM